jgi:H+/Cl- antiporter ClcA
LKNEEDSSIKREICRIAVRQREYIKAFLKWLAAAVIIGGICGLVGTAFYHCVAYATKLRGEYPWLLFLLPVCGLAIAGLYRLLKMENDKGTNLIIASVQANVTVPLRMSLLIFVSTVLTHLFGGSAGREGAALQIGGAMGAAGAKLIHADESMRKILTLCGMSAVFSALFGTPLTAAIFCIEVINIGIFYGAELLPCLVSALTAYFTADALGVTPEKYTIVSAPSFTPVSVLQVVVLGVVCALMSTVFCIAVHRTAELFHGKIKNAYIRAAFGGVLIVLLTLVFGRDYNGAGGNIIEKAIEGSAVPWAFAVKLLFTAITLGTGFKGGEIVPSFYVGATLGCVIGPLIGLPASFSAAMCLVGVFCGVVNCPIASIILSFELFGGENILFFAVVCAVSFVLSGEYSLYSSQKLMFSKIGPEIICRHAH